MTTKPDDAPAAPTDAPADAPAATFESPNVGFFISPQPMVFRVAEHAGMLTLIAQSPSVLDLAGSGGFSIQMDTATAQRLARLLFHTAKQVIVKKGAQKSTEKGTRDT